MAHDGCFWTVELKMIGLAANGKYSISGGKWQSWDNADLVIEEVRFHCKPMAFLPLGAYVYHFWWPELEVCPQ